MKKGHIIFLLLISLGIFLDNKETQKAFAQGKDSSITEASKRAMNYVNSLPPASPPIDMNNLYITGTFGEPRNDHFHNGLDMGGRHFPEIRPPYAGEMVYYFDSAEDPSRQIFGAGNYAVMEHMNGRLRTFYYHLKAGSIDKDYASFTTNDVIAVTGNSGRSGGPHLHFGVEDAQNNIMIDPLSILPKLNEKRRPKIWGIYLRTEYRLIPLRNGMRIRYNGRMKLFVKAHDMMGYIRTGPRKVKIFIDDKLVREYDFSYFIRQDFNYYIAPKYSYTEVYGVDKYYYRGGYFTPNKSRHTFKTIVEDFAGNVTTMSRYVYF